MNNDIPLVTTIPEKCKMCYTCVRECPAKAIRIQNGQAKVVAERCIGCGNCVRACSQNAKQYYNSIIEVKGLLGSDKQTIAIVAPSFPANYPDMDHRYLVGMLRKLGFDYICEVALGADMVAYEYRNLITRNPDKWYIATTCPGVVSYVEKYHPELITFLAPVGSPMIISARLFHKIYGNDKEIVFIGPCLAKKEEAFKNASVSETESRIASVLTYAELDSMFRESGINKDNVEPSDFDLPAPSYGGLFPLQGGMLQAADMRIDLLNSDILMADGKEDFVSAIDEVSKRSNLRGLLELLCCKGCIMGAGIVSDFNYFKRRASVGRYVNGYMGKRKAGDNKELFHKLLADGLNMYVNFISQPVSCKIPTAAELKKIMKRMGKSSVEDELNCRACGYNTCREHAKAIFSGLAENEMCLPYTIERLNNSLHDLHVSKSKLEKAREALFNAEKLASMGQLSAGIAHEINNPLGAILLNANLVLEDIADIDIPATLREDLQLIVDEATQCKSIVSSLLNFARKSKLILVPTRVDSLIGNCLRSITKPDNINVKINNNIKDPIAEIQGEKIIQVVVNIVLNAIDAMPDGGRITISLSDMEETIMIKIKDTGTGIPQKHVNKIFEPLFTTKQIGKGTGLGLAVSYGIIKMHEGNISVTTNDNPEKGPTGTEFTIILPRKSK